MTRDADVIVVGASMAGCTAARLFAQSGARVLLLEKHSRSDAYKVLCTHTVQPSALPVAERIGLRPLMEAAGAVPHAYNYWTEWGWVAPRAEPGGEPLQHGMNLRRQALDPILRKLAADTPGVDLRLGQTVTGLVREDGPAGDRVVGVRTRSQTGQEQTLRARLVVGADGRASSVAELGGVAKRQAPNNRFAYFAYFQDLQPREHPPTNVWFLDPNGAYVMPNEDGISVVIVAPKKTDEDMAEFRADTDKAFRRYVRELPDAPPIDDVERTSKYIGLTNHPLQQRPAHAAPGLALIGDAALSTDPMWGVGCAWGMQSASWLVDSLGGAAVGEADLETGLAGYGERFTAELGLYEILFESFATARPLNALERLMYSAASQDQTTARHLYRFGSRLINVPEFVDPSAIARAVGVQRVAAPDDVLADLRQIPFLDHDEIERLVKGEPTLAAAGA